MVEERQPEGRGRPRKTSPYSLWKAAEGIPVHAGSYIDSLYTVEVGPWGRVGQSGAIINLANQEQDDGWVIEIAPGGQTNVLHHMFEATFYVLSGRGATMFWQEGQPKDSVEWKRGSIFSPPLNCHYQHFNGDGEAPTRLFAVTNAPMVINLFRDGEFPFNDTFQFNQRYESGSGFFDTADQRLSAATLGPRTSSATYAPSGSTTQRTGAPVDCLRCSRCPTTRWRRTAASSRPAPTRRRTATTSGHTSSSSTAADTRSFGSRARSGTEWTGRTAACSRPWNGNITSTSTPGPTPARYLALTARRTRLPSLPGVHA